MKSNNRLSRRKKSMIGRWEPLVPQYKTISNQTTIPVKLRPTHPNTEAPNPSSAKPPAITDPNAIFTGALEDYKLGRVIGKGAFAVVREALHIPTGTSYAIKSYDKQNSLKHKKSIIREIKVLKSLDHPNIVHFKEAIDDCKSIHIVMELVHGLPLNTYIDSLTNVSEEVFRKIFRQILLAVKACHDKNICHRDIKLENILVDSNHFAKLIDFGFSTIDTDDKPYQLFCGTPCYLAPEIVLKEKYKGQCADVWALGVLLYSMLTKNFPFKAPGERDLFKKIIVGEFDTPPNVHPQARLMIKKMLQSDAKKRPSVDSLLLENWIHARDDTIDPEIKELLAELGYSDEEIAEGLCDEESDITRLFKYFETRRKKHYGLFNNYLTIVG